MVKRVKKHVSAFMALVMAISLFAPVLSALAAEDYSDYVPGEKPANLITSPKGWAYGTTNSTEVDVGWEVNSQIVKFAANNDFELASNSYWAANGIKLNASGYNGGEALSANTNYVYSTMLKTAEGTSPKFTITYQSSNGKCFTLEHGIEGYTPSSDYEPYSVTFNTGSNTSGAIWLGLRSATTGDKILQDLTQGVYLAKEEVYDITNEVMSESTVEAGASVSLKTEVVNQVGIKGTMLQNFKYTVLNADRTQVADGFTVTEGEDGTATVAIADAVATGDYVILAESEDYAGFRKGAVISVVGEDAYHDYVPSDIPANLFSKPVGYSYSGSNAANPNNAWATGSSTLREFTVTADFALTSSSTWAINGLSHSGYTVDTPFEENTSYVYSTHVKTLAGSPKMGIAYQVGYSSHKMYPVEYGSDGYTPSADDFEEYKATFNTGSNATGTLWFGMYAGSAGDKLVQNLGDTTYLAKEVAHDISVDVTGSSTVFPGGTTKVKAKALNQLDITGTLAQNFTWTALTSDRSSVANCITITQGADGTAIVEASDNAPTGDYVIFAVSQDYKKLRKGAVISVVSEDAYQEHVPSDMPANLLSTPTSWYYTGGNSTVIDSAWLSGSSTERVYTANTDFALTSSSTWALNGLSVGKYTVTPAFEANTSYVYSTYVKTTSGSPKMNIAYQIGSGSGSYKAYPIEHGATGYTPGSEYEQYKATFNTGAATGGTLWFGIYSASEGDTFCQNFSMPSYLAKEVPYDIKLSPSAQIPEELEGGDSIVFDALVLNQIGVAGTLSQNFEWYALKDGKTSFTSDITFSINDTDTSHVTATLDKNIENGTYYILAKSKDYENLVRTYQIAVGAVGEYTPGEIPANMVIDPDNANVFQSNNGAAASMHAQKTGEYYSWAGNKAANTYWKVGHSYLTVSGGHLSGSFTSGKNYVISVRLKNGAADVNSAPLFGVAIGFNKVWSQPVASTEYTTYSATVTAPADASTVSIGFDASVDRSALASPEVITMDTSNGGSLYIAEEVAYDINTKVISDSTVLTPGTAFTVSAELVNQLGIKGSLSQDLVWNVLDSNKASFNTGFDLEVSADSTQATVTPSARMPYGTYYLAVSPASDSSMVKLVKFRLKREVLRLYVSPDGSDSNIGSISAPFKTIAKAKEAVRAIHDKDLYMGIEVILRGGEYRFTDTLAFAQEDSGTEETPVIYKAYDGEAPVIKGSVVLDTSKLHEVLSSDIVPRLHDKAKGKVMVIDLAEQGLTDNQIFDMSQAIATFYNLSSSCELNSLFVDGVMQTLSQWPNDRNYSIRGNAIVDETILDSNGKQVKVSTSFNYTEPEPDRWANATGWYIGTFMPYDYSYARLSVKELDTVNKILKVHGKEGNKIDFNFTNNFSKRWKAFNLLEEIDLPGEYSIDSENKLLYYYPPHDMEDAKLEISTMFDSLISVTEADNITFDGISFAQTNGMAISMKNVENVDVKNCTFAGIGGTAISIGGTVQAQTNKDYWQRQMLDASYNCDITDNVLTNIAGVAITISGGNVDTLTKSNNIVANNFIHDYNNKHLGSAAGAISIGGCGNTVRNNNISVSPGVAIYMNGNDHLVEYNEIYDVMREVQDAGAIYQGRNAIARGTVIQYNYLHDMRSLHNLTHSSQVGIYLDDCQHGLTVVNNIIRNVKVDFNSNGAAAYTFSGNTSLDVDKAWSFLNHASTATSTVTSGPGGTLEFIESQIYDKELYFEHYPDLEKFLDVDRVPGNNPKYFTVAKDNLAVNAGATNIQSENLAYSTLSNNEAISDEAYSIFADAANQDYRIKSDSQYALNTRLTESFDIDKIGLQNSFMLTDDASSFSQLYPANASTVAYTEDGITFAWGRALGATQYRLVVATDKLFENVVYDETTRLNTHTVTSLTNNTKYYWKVIASNTSRELPYTWNSKDGAMAFTLSDYEYAVSLDGTTMDTAANVITVSTTAANNSVSDTSDFTVTIAAYDEDSLCAVEQYDVSIPLGQSVPITHSFDTKGEYTVEEIKVFVWRKGTLTPLREARILR